MVSKMEIKFKCPKMFPRTVQPTINHKTILPRVQHQRFDGGTEIPN